MLGSPFEKDDLNQFLLFILEESILLQDTDSRTANRSYNKLLQNRSSLISPKQVHSPSGQNFHDWVELKEYLLCLEQGGCLDRDSRIEEDPTLILEPKTEFQAWLKGVSGQGVYPSELRTDPRGSKSTETVSNWLTVRILRSAASFLVQNRS